MTRSESTSEESRLGVLNGSGFSRECGSSPLREAKLLDDSDKNRSQSFVLTEVETLGVARSLGWKVHMRCANGYRQEARSMRR